MNINWEKANAKASNPGEPVLPAWVVLLGIVLFMKLLIFIAS